MQPGYTVFFPSNIVDDGGETTYGSFTVSNSWPRQTGEARDLYLDQFTGETLAEQGPSRCTARAQHRRFVDPCCQSLNEGDERSGSSGLDDHRRLPGRCFSNHPITMPPIPDAMTTIHAGAFASPNTYPRRTSCRLSRARAKIATATTATTTNLTTCAVSTSNTASRAGVRRCRCSASSASGHDKRSTPRSTHSRRCAATTTVLALWSWFELLSTLRAVPGVVADHTPRRGALISSTAPQRCRWNYCRRCRSRRR